MKAIGEDLTRFSIEKFNGMNFVYWKLKIDDVLYEKILYQSLRGKSKKPAIMSDAD